jgi:hypothetical protein
MIYLPLLQSTDDGYKKHRREIDGTYHVTISRKYNDNPLCMATNDSSVEEKLLLCPDNVTNKTQLEPLLKFSEFAFIRMKFVDNGSLLKFCDSMPDNSKASTTRKDQHENTDQKRKINRVSTSSKESKVYVKETAVKTDSDDTTTTNIATDGLPGTSLY